MKTQEERRAEIFKLLGSITGKAKFEITSLIFDLSEAAYRDGLDKGADIAKSIYT